jgi:hypothetical protein
MIRKGIAIFMLIAFSFFLFGCADRKEKEEEVAPGSSLEADKALEKAEKVMQENGIAVSFDELGSVSDLSTILPDPLEIARLEKGVIEESVSSLYEALDALGDVTPQAAPAAPAIIEASNSDLAMLHLHIAYLYVLEAIRQLMIVRFDENGNEMYTITYPEQLDTENVEVYDFALSDELQAEFDRLDADPDTDEYDYLRMFSEAQRQAILNALVLLTGVEVSIEANPAEGIVGQTPDVNRQIFRQNALYHIDKALNLAILIAPDVQDAYLEFKQSIQDEFSYGLLEDARKWGFDVNEDTLPEDLRGGGQ